MPSTVSRLALVLFMLAAGSDGALADPQLRVELGSDGRATVVGSGTSVRTLLEQLCWESGAVLHYDAPDQAFSVALEDQPLERVIARLLRQQSYVLRMAHGPDGRPQLSELRVLGAGGIARRQLQAESPAAARPPSGTPDFFVPLSVLDATFGDADPDHREAAMRELIEAVRSDPVRRRAFLDADPATLSPALRQYPQAAAILRSLSAQPDLDPEMRSKLETLITQLE